ncbi:MAG: ferric reductase-like transmembrane domain-containing protein [Anaerolineae bacterium]
MIRTFVRGFGAQRATTHLLLAALTTAGIYATHLYSPHAGAEYVFTIGFGYLSVLFLCASLLFGPLNLMRRRINPVNIDLRRDTGIWAGITGCLHVVFAVVLHNRGSVLAFFFNPRGRLLLDPAGASNWIGLAATLLLVLLLLLSNQLSLRRLKGKRWKQIQRLNYVLAALAFVHTFLYQRIGGRERGFVQATAIAVLVVLVIQLIGVSVYQRRKREQLRR